MGFGMHRAAKVALLILALGAFGAEPIMYDPADGTVKDARNSQEYDFPTGTTLGGAAIQTGTDTGDEWGDAVDADIVPDADGTRDLGATGTRFAETYTDSLDVTGNVTVGGTVDGRDVAADGAVLDAIEPGATTDQTDAEILTAVESESGRDMSADGTKLDGIEPGATTDQTDAEIETAYNNQVDVVTQGEAEAGTDSTVHRWTPERVKQAIDALAPGGGGGGSMTTVKEADAQVGGADIVTLDFGAGFDTAETPDTEIQITIDASEFGSATPTLADTVVIYDTSGTATAKATLTDLQTLIDTDTRVGVWRNIWLGAAAWQEDGTTGPERTTQDEHFVLAFAGDASETARLSFAMPATWNAGTVKFDFHWKVASGASAADAVAWEISGAAVDNDEAWPPTTGTAVETQDTVIVVGDLHVVRSASVTIDGAAALELVELELFRDHDAVTQIPEDAYLLGVMMHYQESSTEPSAP